jgi:hypothetical protein
MLLYLNFDIAFVYPYLRLKGVFSDSQQEYAQSRFFAFDLTKTLRDELLISNLHESESGERFKLTTRQMRAFVAYLGVIAILQSRKYGEFCDTTCKVRAIRLTGNDTIKS